MVIVEPLFFSHSRFNYDTLVLRLDWNRLFTHWNINIYTLAYKYCSLSATVSSRNIGNEYFWFEHQNLTVVESILRIYLHDVEMMAEEIEDFLLTSTVLLQHSAFSAIVKQSLSRRIKAVRRTRL